MGAWPPRVSTLTHFLTLPHFFCFERGRDVTRRLQHWGSSPAEVTRFSRPRPQPIHFGHAYIPFRRVLLIFPSGGAISRSRPTSKATENFKGQSSSPPPYYRARPSHTCPAHSCSNSHTFQPFCQPHSSIYVSNGADLNKHAHSHDVTIFSLIFNSRSLTCRGWVKACQV